MATKSASDNSTKARLSRMDNISSGTTNGRFHFACAVPVKLAYKMEDAIRAENEDPEAIEHITRLVFVARAIAFYLKHLAQKKIDDVYLS